MDLGLQNKTVLAMATSKGLGKAVATEFSRDTIAPGRIATDRIKELDGARAQATGMSEEEIHTLNEKAIPLGRYGTPQEFAKTVVFLGSGANTYVTGSSLLVDSGMVKAL